MIFCLDDDDGPRIYGINIHMLNALYSNQPNGSLDSYKIHAKSNYTMIAPAVTSKTEKENKTMERMLFTIFHIDCNWLQRDINNKPKLKTKVLTQHTVFMTYICNGCFLQKK